MARVNSMTVDEYRHHVLREELKKLSTCMGVLITDIEKQGFALGDILADMDWINVGVGPQWLMEWWNKQKEQGYYRLEKSIKDKLTTEELEFLNKKGIFKDV